jgi:hypothetical protein
MKASSLARKASVALEPLKKLIHQQNLETSSIFEKNERRDNR